MTFCKLIEYIDICKWKLCPSEEAQWWPMGDGMGEDLPPTVVLTTWSPWWASAYSEAAAPN